MNVMWNHSNMDRGPLYYNCILSLFHFRGGGLSSLYMFRVLFLHFNVQHQMCHLKILMTLTADGYCTTYLNIVKHSEKHLACLVTRLYIFSRWPNDPKGGGHQLLLAKVRMLIGRIGIFIMRNLFNMIWLRIDLIPFTLLSWNLIEFD